MLARAARAELYLELFELRSDSFSATLSFDTSVVTFEGEDSEPGAWLRGPAA